MAVSYTHLGFDKDAKQYTYNVNANTGVSSLNGTPFQVQICLLYTSLREGARDGHTL